MTVIVTQMVIDGVALVGQPIPWGYIRDKHFMTTHTWHDGAASKAAVSERPHGHGAYDLGDPYRESLLISVEGWSWGSTRAEWQRLRNQLMALGADSCVVLARLIDGGEDTWRWVQVVKVTPKGDRATNRTHWTIDLRAADPRRYGPPITPATQQVSAASSAGFNLLANPGFEAGVSGWFAVIGPGTRHEPLTWVQSGPWGGSAGRYTLTAAADSLSVGTVVALSQPPRFATVAAQSSRDAVLHLTVSWLDAAGRLLVVEKLADQQVAAGQWVTLSGVVRPPAGAATAWLMVDGADAGPWPAGSSLTVDQALLGGSMTSTYRDGDSPGWEWTGTVGASPSRMAGAVWELDNTAGTASSIPRLSFVPAAPLSAWTVGVSGHGVLAWSGQTIPAGTVVTVDAEAHQVLINGQLPERRWSGVWPEVAAGELAYLVLTTGEVAASATCVWSPAWW